jgi:uncharacterized membrane protein YfcA
MVLAALATLVGSILQSATGFGVALVVGPAVFGFFEPTAALTTLLILSSVLNLLVLGSERRTLEVRGDRLVPLLSWALPGLAAGALILAAVSKPALQVAVGVAVIVAVAVQARARALRPHGQTPSEPLWATPAAGLTTGVLATTTGTSGPPLVLWFEHLGFRPAEMRDTLAAAFQVLNLLAAAALLLFGDGLASPGTAELITLVALAVVGQLIGRRLFEGMPPERFRLAGLILVAAAGVASVVAGLAATS